MIKIRSIKFTFIYLCIILLAGCFRAPVKPTLEAAHRKFKKLCKEEYGIDVVLRPLKNTLWIYVPLDHRITENVASDKLFADLPILGGLLGSIYTPTNRSQMYLQVITFDLVLF